MDKKIKTPYISNVCSLPLHQLLYENGYMIDRSSYSKNSPAFIDEGVGGKIIVTKKIDKNGNEVYLYYNVKHDWDRGNILNFCANRNINIQDFVQTKLANQPSLVKLDSIGRIDHKEMKAILDEFNALPEYTDNTLLENRGIYFSTIAPFLVKIKEDSYRNLCIPNYQLETIENRKILMQCGYTKRLKTPLLKDKDGNLREKPLKTICRGKKGMEILLPHAHNLKESLKDIKSLIITESIIDTLSFIQLRQLDPNNTVAISTGGNFDKNQTPTTLISLVNELQTKTSNQISIFIAMDNDEKGIEFSNILEKNIIQHFHRMPIIYRPFAKDVNDDLKISQIISNNQVNFENMHNFCKSRINEYRFSQSTTKKRNILEDFRKLDKLKQLPDKIKERFNSISKHKSIKAI